MFHLKSRFISVPFICELEKSVFLLVCRAADVGGASDDGNSDVSRSISHFDDADAGYGNARLLMSRLLLMLLKRIMLVLLTIRGITANTISEKQLYAFDENVCESASFVFGRASGSLVYLFN